jgi:hypothetical protein
MDTILWPEPPLLGREGKGTQVTPHHHHHCAQRLFTAHLLLRA